MSRRRRIVVAAVGLALVAWGGYLAVSAPGGRELSPPVTAVLVLVALVALAGSLWKVRGRLDTGADALPVPWDPGEPFASPAPERTAEDYRLSSVEFADVVKEAGAAARNEGTVDDGIGVVRPPLREALLDALVQGGHSRSAARDLLADGTWTDDRDAAAVLDEAVSPPDRTLRERSEAWLYPKRVVRRRTRRAMQAVAEAADDALPTVPGETAPRTVPVLRPPLEDLRRGANGRLQRAVDPTAVARGPEPADPPLDAGATDGNEAAGARDEPNDGRAADPREVSDR